MQPRWSKKQAHEWYDAQPWFRGCNYMSADCVNRVDQWQELGFEERLRTVDKELDIAQEIGFNSVRLIVQFEVWQQEHNGFMKRLEQYIEMCHKHQISVMLCIANDCSVPKAIYEPKKLGKQEVDWGYHGGVKKSPHMSHSQGPGFTVLDDPELAPQFYQMTAEIIETYKNDPRIAFWDLINEPGAAGRGEISLPIVKKLFEIAWDINPIQPLTACIWSNIIGGGNPSELLAAELSDIVTFHSYSGFQAFVRAIDILKDRYERPLVNTEWLHRIQHNNVHDLFPLMFLEKIGCYCWGFVAGLYQTYEPWEGMWQLVDQGKAPASWDFTKWQHDLIRPNHRPYDPAEINCIKLFSSLADKNFKNKSQAQN
jgi:hypothetical protein